MLGEFVWLFRRGLRRVVGIWGEGRPRKASCWGEKVEIWMGLRVDAKYVLRRHNSRLSCILVYISYHRVKKDLQLHTNMHL